MASEMADWLRYGSVLCELECMYGKSEHYTTRRLPHGIEREKWFFESRDRQSEKRIVGRRDRGNGGTRKTDEAFSENRLDLI
jgi:hypothetical protein